jgi:hypothetical protein
VRNFMVVCLEMFRSEFSSKVSIRAQGEDGLIT